MGRAAGLVTERSPELLGGAAERHACGSYYTPRWLAERVVQLAVAPVLNDALADRRGPVWRRLRRALELSVVDPAVGDGVFLACAAEYVAQELAKVFGAAIRLRRGTALNQLRGAVMRRMLFGVDIQPAAVGATKEWLDRLAECHPGNRRALDRHIICGNSVRCRSLEPSTPVNAVAEDWFDWGARFPRVFDCDGARRGFAVVIGNPPFVDAETMTRIAAELRGELGRRWKSARGNWDLFVPFVELSLELARPGGQVGLVLPNKLLSAKYAAALRKLLRRERLRSLLDCSTEAAFAGADVYPLVMHVERAPARGDALIQIVAPLGDSTHSTVRSVPQAVLESLPEQAWHALFAPDVAELASSWRGMIPLGELAEIHGAATVAEAYDMAGEIVDWPHDDAPPSKLVRLVNTGTLDRYGHRWGRSGCRYLGQSYLRPVLQREELLMKWPRRAAQAAAAKLIVAGLGRELRACWDRDGGLLAGKSTVVITSQQVDLRLLAAVLNSAWMSRCYRALFGGLALQGGYLQFTTAHLKAIPFPALDWISRHPDVAAAICDAVERIQDCRDAVEFRRLDEGIENAVVKWAAMGTASGCSRSL